MAVEQTESSICSSGTNVNAAYTIPEARAVGYGAHASRASPIDRVSVTGAAKLKGVTRRAIVPGATGDVAVAGVEMIETDGTGTVERGDRLAVSVAVDANEGRVFSTRATPPGIGVTFHILGIAEDPAPAAVTRIRIRLTPGATLRG
jgi:hypothetical protein